MGSVIKQQRIKATRRIPKYAPREALVLCRSPESRGTANDNSRIYLCFANDTVAYGYDNLGRVNSRTIDVAVDSVTYDVLGRVNQHSVQDLGVFNYGYLGQTGAVTSRFKTVNNISTTWGYDTNANDRRLLNITNSNNARSYALASNPYQLTGDTQTMPAGHPWLSQSFAYIYDKSDRLLSSTSGATVTSYGYDKLDNATSFAGVTGTYDVMNQISTFGGVTHTYDANGNLTNDGTRSYTYDAADRLVRINTIGNATKKSEFGYDGLGRRITQTETPTTGAAITTRNLWCGSRLCQERTSADVVTARYYPEGERRPVAVEAYVYMPDSLGSVRELVGAGSGILKFAYDYDAYGKPTRSWTNVSSADTKFRYAGLMYHAQSGLYLSTTRAYDPARGKWLNRDPKKEAAAGENQFTYTLANPIRWNDPTGLDIIHGEYIDQNGHSHGLIIIYDPATGEIRERQSFGLDNGFREGEPGSGKVFDPTKWWPGESQFWKERFATSREEDDQAVALLKLMRDKRDVYQFGVKDCNKYSDMMYDKMVSKIKLQRALKFLGLL